MTPREARTTAQRIGRSGREFAGDRLILSAWLQSFAEWSEITDTIGRDRALNAARTAARATERG
jgi:hypothetical protein